MECSREGELGSDMPTWPRGGMAPSAGEAADGSDMTKKPRRGMGPSVVKAAAGATFSTATSTGRRPTTLLESGGMGIWKPKVSHGTSAEELLSAPARRTVRPSPRNKSLCELAGVAQGRRHDQRSPDSIKSVGCQRRGSRKVPKEKQLQEASSEDEARSRGCQR